MSIYYSKEDDSLELKFAVHSITKMDDIFSFMKDYNILIIKDNYELVKNKLSEWFKSSKFENFALDKNFLNKYRNNILNDVFLKNLYKDKL